MLLFFDIDGTLWNYKNEIPKSTVDAIRQARENGHKCFINTGRSRGFVTNKNLLGIGFDGIVSACGSMIEYNDQVIFNHMIDTKDIIFTLNTIKEYGFKPILEGHEHLYLEIDDFKDDMYGSKVINEMGDRLRGINECWGNWQIQKISCKTDIPTKERDICFNKLNHLFDYIIHSDTVVEMVPKGFNKGTGIVKVCELLGEDVKNTFSFGDSVNDIDMLVTAGTGIAMGETYHDLSKYADYITTSLENHGISNAMKHFALI